MGGSATFPDLERIFNGVWSRYNNLLLLTLPHLAAVAATATATAATTTAAAPAALVDLVWYAAGW